MEAEKFIQRYKELVDSGLFTERIIEHRHNRDDLEKERAESSFLLQKEIEKVVLGDDLKGNCAICRQFRLI